MNLLELDSNLLAGAISGIVLAAALRLIPITRHLALAALAATIAVTALRTGVDGLVALGDQLRAVVIARPTFVTAFVAGSLFAALAIRANTQWRRG